jgi:hypothetical protein
MTIAKIHGFKPEGTSFSTEPQRFVISEQVLVEADHANITAAQIIDALPSFASGPGTTDFNPLQLTFTINQSRHPDGNNYILESTQNLRRHSENDCFWIVPLRYSTALPWDMISFFSGQRIDQRVKNVDKDYEYPEDKPPIISPLDRPPIFSGSSKIVMRESRFDRNGDIIKHTNGLPITQPVSVPVVHRNWSWSFNISASTFDITDFETVENKTNSLQLNIPQGSPSTTAYPVPANRLKCMGFSYFESYETPANSTTEFHYVRVTVNFEFSEDPWNTPPLSMHTKQRIAGGAPLIPIQINNRGDIATEPWPLDEDGVAFSPDDLLTVTESEFGRLQADGADLVICEEVDMTNFFAGTGFPWPRLTFPRRR